MVQKSYDNTQQERKKMTKKIMVLFALGMIFSPLYAKKADADKFFYDKGFSDGKTEGMRIGYEKAKKEVLAKLKNRLTAIKAMEAGKYLSKKHKITAPQIYQVKKPDGSMSVLVKGCRLEGELTPEEIVLLPKAESNYAGISGANADSILPSTVETGSNKGVSNGVFMPGIDSNRYDKPALAGSMTNTVYKYLPNTAFYTKLLRSSGFPYTISNGGVNLKVRFSSEREAITFLKRYDLEPGRDVK